MSRDSRDSVTARPWYATRLAIGVVTVLLSVALAAMAPGRVVGGTHELFGFALWTMPLGFAVSMIARRWRFERVFPIWRAAVLSLVGLLFGIGWTLVGWFVVGRLMLAWDFPVLYCWAFGSALGVLFGARVRRSIRSVHAVFGTVVAFTPLAALAWQDSRPRPAVLIVYRESPERDAAQLVLDSVLSVPHASGTGRQIRWPYMSYSRTRYQGHVAAMIVLHDADDRQPLRRAVTGHPLVLTVIDTVIARGE